MKSNKKITVAVISALTALSISTFVAYAEPTDSSFADESTYSSDIYDTPDSSTADTPSSDYTSSYDDTTSYDTPDYSSDDSGDYYEDYSSDYSSDYYYDDYSSDYSSDSYQGYYSDYSTSSYGDVIDREQEYYESGTMGDDTTQPVVDNKLYDTNSDISSDEMEAGDWDIALDLDSSNGGDDFNFIKNNTSEEDSVWYQMILFGGILLITVSIFGIILIIILTARAHKMRKKAMAAKGKRAGRAKGRTKGAANNPKPQFSIESEQIKREKLDSVDTAEIDLSKYDKYL